MFAYELVTAEQSLDRQRRAAAALHAAGCRIGDRVAVVAHNHPDVIALVVGSLRIGVVPVMVNPDLLPAEQQVILGDCGAQIQIDDSSLCSFLDEADVAQWNGSLSDVPLARPMHYTSGTTGRPKGVWSGILDIDGATQLLLEERDLWGFCADDRNLVCSPLYHSAPLRFALGTLLAGGSVVVLRKFSAEGARDAIDEHRITTAFMAPAHLQRLFELPTSEQPLFDSRRRTVPTFSQAASPCRFSVGVDLGVLRIHRGPVHCLLFGRLAQETWFRWAAAPKPFC